MRHLAIGYACSLNDILVRFPYNKCTKAIRNIKETFKRRALVKKVFREGIKLILQDIIDNNATFKLPATAYRKAEIHFEAITGSDFETARINGKFKEIDFLESLFTGFQLYLFVSNTKTEKFLGSKKYPIYVGGNYKKQIVDNTNKGKVYC